MNLESLMCYIKFLQNYKMPEVRTATRLPLAGISGGGFFTGGWHRQELCW
jgi:hypothetical protein